MTNFSNLIDTLKDAPGNHRLFAVTAMSIIVGSFVDIHAILVILVAFLVAHSLSGLARRRSRLDALLALVFGSLAFSFFIQLVGELAGSWATSSPTTALALIAILWFGCERRSARQEALKVSAWHAALIASPIIALSFAVMSMSTADRVTFLGYGYDNAAHLEQGRVILHEGGSLLLSGGSEAAPTFVQDAAQVGGALIATTAKLVGIDASSTAGLTAVLLALTIVLPALISLAVFAVLRDGGKSWTTSVVVSSTVSVALFATYLSRIWFSGYLASNLGTLGLALLVAYLARPTHRDPFIAMMLVVACGHTYTIFLFVATIISLPVVLSELRGNLVGSRKLPARDLAVRFGLVVAAGSTLVLPYIATRRSFAPSQFLVDGGIEKLPVASVLLFVAVSSAPLLAQAYRRMRTDFIIMIAFIVAIAAGVARYSIAEKGYISYYPTKIIIAMAVCMIMASVTLYSSSSRRKQDLPVALVSLAVIATVVLPQQPGTVFAGAYMGRMSEVLPQLTRPTPLVVNGELNVKLAEIAEGRQTPVLLLSQLYESELNSRWINVLAGTWTDDAWSDWMTTRTLLSDTAILPSESTSVSILVATDSAAEIQSAKSAGFEVCAMLDYPSIGTFKC